MKLPYSSVKKRTADIGVYQDVFNYSVSSHGLYIFYPIFEDHFSVFKEVFLENSVLMYGLYSRGVCNQERVIMKHIQYFHS